MEVPNEAMSAVDGVMGNPLTPTPPPAATSAAAIAPDAQSAVDGVMHDDTSSQIKLNAGAAAGTSPDQEAVHRQIASQTGIPLSSVQAQPDLAKQQAAALSIDADGIAKNTPVTARFLTDASNMKVASDDINNLQAVEKSVVPPTAGNIGKGLLTDLVLGMVKTVAGSNAFITDELGLPESVTQHSLDTIRGADKAIEQNTPTFDSTLGKWTYGGASGMVSMLPIIAAALYSGPLAGAAMFGTQGAAQGYGKYRARGATPDQATTGGIIEGAIQAGTSFLPLNYLTTKLGKAGAGEFLANLIGRDVVAMNVQGLSMGAVDTAIANPTKTWTDYVKDIPGTVGQSTVAGLMFGGVFGAVNAVAGRSAKDEAKAQTAQQGADFLKSLSDASAASKLRLRDPDAFNAFVKQAAEGGPVQDVYLNPNTLAQEKIDTAELVKAMPDMQDKLATAQATGTDIKIPVQDFATKLAGTDFGAAVLDHLKTDPEGMSKAESEHFFQTQGPELQAQVDKILEQKKGDDVFKASSDAVHENIMGQLKAANRFTDDVNKPYASLISNFYAVQAARTGATPEELFAKYPLNIVRSLDEGKVLNQETLAQMTKRVIQKYDAPGARLGSSGVVFEPTEYGNTITLRSIRVPEGMREKGVGTELMRALTQHADATGKRIVLSPTSDFGGNLNRLRAFYKGFGFVDNKGRNKDFTTRESMIRDPQILHQEGKPDNNLLDTGFYSKMQKHLEQKLNGSGTPEDYLNQVRAMVKAGGFKADELKFSGLEDYLKNAGTIHQDNLDAAKDAIDRHRVEIDALERDLKGSYSLPSRAELTGTKESKEIDLGLHKTQLETKLKELEGLKSKVGDKVKLTKQDILDFIDQNPFQVHETQLGEDGEEDNDDSYPDMEFDYSDTEDTETPHVFQKTIDIGNGESEKIQIVGRKNESTAAGAEKFPMKWSVYKDGEPLNDKVYATKEAALALVHRDLETKWADRRDLITRRGGETTEGDGQHVMFPDKPPAPPLSGFEHTQPELNHFTRDFIIDGRRETYTVKESPFNDEFIVTRLSEHDDTPEEEGRYESMDDAKTAIENLGEQQRQWAEEDFRRMIDEDREENPQNRGDTQFSQYKEAGGENYRELITHLPNSPIENVRQHFKQWATVMHARISDYSEKINGKREKVLFIQEMQSDAHQQARTKRVAAIDKLIKDGMTKEEAQKKIPNDYGYGKVDIQTLKQVRIDKSLAYAKMGEVEERKETHYLKMFVDGYGTPGASKVVQRTDAAGINTGSSYEMTPVGEDEHGDFRYYIEKDISPKDSEGRTRVMYHAWIEPMSNRESHRVGGGHDTAAEAINSLAKRATRADTDVVNARAKYDSLVEQEHDLGSSNVTDIPFKTTWQELQFKRLMLMAAHEGYDRIAWTTGKMQVDRYEGALRTSIDELRWEKTPEGVHLIGMRGGSERINTHEKETSLSDAIGKAMAKQILADPAQEGTIKGDDLAIDDTGMAGAYDRIMPMLAKKASAAVGGKGEIEPVEMSFGKTRDRQAMYEAAGVKDLGEFSDLSPEQRAAADLKAEAEANTVMSIPISDEMKAKIKEGFPLYQGNRGAFNPETSTISLLKAADLSTFLHESGHFFLETMNKLAQEANAPEGIKQDMQTTLDWLGVKDLAEWNSKTLEQQRNAHEQFARGFEAYLFEGKSPSIEIAGVFARFRAWLLNVYQSLAKLNVELSPEIRGVFDRMLATTEQIKQAEDARNFTALFTKPEDAQMSQEEFKAYHDLGVEATQDAITALQARSMRDMKWASDAKAGVLKKMQKSAEEKRKSVGKEVSKEVYAEPINKARAFIKRGEIDGKKVDGPHRLDLDAVKEKIAIQRGSGGAAANLDELQSKFGAYGVLGRDGIHPDTAAEMFGFSSGDELIKQLIEAENPVDKIAGMTDQRMLERYGDLNSPEAIDKAADEAVHNKVRTRFVATELSALDKAVGNKKLLAAQAKMFVENMISRMSVREAVLPGRFLAAETRAGKEAMKALKAGDLPAAAKAKRDQLVNSLAAAAAYEAQNEVDKIQRNAKRYDRKSVRERIGTDIALIDNLFDKYDLRKNPVEKEDQKIISLRTWYDAQREAGYEPSIDERLMIERDRTHYKDLSMEALRGLDAAARSIEKVARSRKEITRDGKKIALENVVKELLVPMQERGDKFTKAELIEAPAKGTDSVMSRVLHVLGSKLRLAGTDLKMPDYKRNYYDLHELAGPFGKNIFDPIFDRNYWKIDNLKSMSDDFKAKVDALGEDWQKSLTDLVTNNTLSDPDLAEPGAPATLKVTRARLLGMARHFGNESNFAKLYKGYGWKPEELWKFVMDNMRENDWKAVNAEWETFERYWPESEAMIRRLGGVVPDKIPLRPFKTPFGEMKGGYAPIDYDPIRSKLSAKFGEPVPDATTSLAKPQNYKATTTFNGSMNNRAEGYTDRMNLDYHYVTRRLHETIHDLAYREVLIDSRKIISDPKFRDQFMRSYGREEYSGLVKFIDNIANMLTRDTQMNNFERAMQYARQGITMTGIGYRLTTVLKHGGSAAFKSFGQVGGSGRKYLLARIARMSTGNLNDDIKDATQKFPEIRARLLQMDRDYKVGGNSLYEPEDWRAKNDRYGHALIAWSDALSAIPTAHAAYDWATSEGVPKSLGGTGEPLSHEAAVQFANKMVREAHGTANETARANFLHDRGIKSLFGTIYAFQNNTFGQLGDMIDKTVIGGKFKNRPEILARAMAQMIMPGVLTYWLSNGKDDKESWGSWMAKAITGEIASTVPGVRDAWNMIEGKMAGADRALQVPAASMITDLGKVGSDIYKELHHKETKIIQDALKAIGEWAHIGGLGQAGKTLQYIHDAHTGKEHPKTALEAVQGATIGVHKPK